MPGSPRFKPGHVCLLFNDPCNEVPPGNELAFGGPWYGPQHAFDGTTWYSIISQFVVVSATASSRTGSLTGYAVGARARHHLPRR